MRCRDEKTRAAPRVIKPATESHKLDVTKPHFGLSKAAKTKLDGAIDLLSISRKVNQLNYRPGNHVNDLFYFLSNDISPRS